MAIRCGGSCHRTEFLVPHAGFQCHTPGIGVWQVGQVPSPAGAESTSDSIMY